MDNKMGVCCFILWLVLLTTTAQGYKSCSEIAAAKKSSPYKIGGDVNSYDVVCNMSADPVTTTIAVTRHVNQVTFPYTIIYGSITKDVLQELVKASEGCKQTITYDCKNDAQFTSNNPSLWFRLNNIGSTNWGNCDGACQCTKSQQTEVRVLTKTQDIPIAVVSFKPGSNISFSVGDLVCYGDTKGAVTLNNRNSFTSVNLTTEESSISFKFKSPGGNKNMTIASIQLKDNGYIKVRVNEQKKVSTVYKIKKTETPILKSFDMVIDKEWHTIEVKMKKMNVGLDVFVAMDGKEHIIMEDSVVGDRAKLIFGERKCYSFVGCVKDVYVGGKDVTKLLQSSSDKEFIVEGCQSVGSVKCSPSSARGGDINPDPEDEDDDDDDDDGDNTAVIVIVVILLLLLILLLVAFFITWYLKRNKGVYQTHEGSAEDIHGDTDNLTLVTKPSEQEPSSQKSKEYYL